MAHLPSRRDVLRTLAALPGAAILLGVSSSTAADATAPATAGDPGQAIPWFRRCLVGIEYGPTGGNDKDKLYMSGASGKEIVQNMVRANVEYFVVFMKDMKFAYYNSRAARKAPNLGQRDLLRECLDEAAAHGLPVIAYCQVQYDDSSWAAHPEWRMRDSAGKEIPGRLCYRSGYLAFVKQVAAEMMEYPIAGFHFDMLDFGFFPPYGCWCDTCRKDFRQKHGIEMPSGVTWDDAWDKMLQFRCDSNTDFCRQLEAFVKATKPGLAVDFNYHGSTPFSWEVGQRPVQHATSGDFVTAEGLPWVFGHYNASLITLFMKAARPDQLVQSVTSRSVYDYHDFTVRPVAEMKWEVCTYLAHGAQCTIVDKANYEGTCDPLAYQRIGEVFADARRKRELFGHQPIQDVGLYFSSRTRDWYGREDPVRYYRAIWGAHKALVQAQIPLGFVCDENVTLARLQAFPIVYLANTAILSTDEIQLFRRYVSDGGNLLVTGPTGLYDHKGALRGNSSLAELCGGRVIGHELNTPDNYLRFSKDLGGRGADWLLRGVPADWAMLTWGPVVFWEAASAEALGQLLVAHRTQDNMWSRRMSPGRVAGPALLVHRLGRGKVVTMAASLDAAFASDYRMPEHRNLLRNLVRYLHPNPVVSAEAPSNLEMVVTEDRARGRLLIHLLAFAGPPTAAEIAFDKGRRVLPAIMEEEATWHASLKLSRRFRRIKPWEPNTTIKVAGQKIDVTATTCHAVLIAET